MLKLPHVSGYPRGMTWRDLINWLTDWERGDLESFERDGLGAGALLFLGRDHVRRSLWDRAN
jgi:hypothetical protein